MLTWALGSGLTNMALRVSILEGELRGTATWVVAGGWFVFDGVLAWMDYGDAIELGSWGPAMTLVGGMIRIVPRLGVPLILLDSPRLRDRLSVRLWGILAFGKLSWYYQWMG